MAEEDSLPQVLTLFKEGCAVAAANSVPLFSSHILIASLPDLLLDALSVVN